MSFSFKLKKPPKETTKRSISAFFLTTKCCWTWVVSLVLFLPLGHQEAAGQVTLELRGSGSFFTSGSSFNFTCVQTGTTQAGNLLFLHNNNTNPAACIVTPLTSCSFSPSPDCGCVSVSGSTRTYVYRRSSMQANDSGNWTCHLPGFLNIIPATSPVLFLPLYVPPNVSAVGPRDLAVRDGDNVIVTCEDTRGVPSPSFSWTSSPQYDVNQSTPSPSRSALTFRADKGKGDSVTLTCAASNDADISSVTFTVTVQYLPPNPPNITGNRDNATYFQNDTVSLTCSVRGGNPPVSNVTLTCPQGHSMTSPGTVSTLTFRAGPSDVGRCECRAFHVLGYSQTAATNITTFYPPSFPNMTLSLGPAPWLKGQNLTLTCFSADPGRPSATYRWLGGHGGSERGDTLVYDSLGEEDNSRVVQCQAVNTFTSSTGLPRVSSLTLVVYYPPVVTVTSIPALQPNGSVTVTEKCEAVNLTCSASGNPSNFSLTWSPRVGQGGQLTFDPVTRDQHGLHTCTAVSYSSKFGSLSSNVTVNVTVLYPPDVTVEVTEVSPREQRVVCSAQARPASLRFGAWVQTWQGQEVRNVTGSQQPLTLTTFQDSGRYTCFVDNGVKDCQGQAVQKNSTTVSVWDTPQLLPSATRVSGETGEARRLHCQLYALPALTNASWYFRSDNVSSGGLYNVSSSAAEVRLSVHGTQVSASGSSLSVDTVVTPDTVGVYTLRACNDVGCSAVNITLLAAGPPFPPEDLRVTDVSSSSVSLTWRPGYAGGDFDLWFLVEFRLHSQPDQWNVYPDNVTSFSVTVEGLLPGSVYVFRVRAQNSRETRNLSNYTVEVTGTTETTDAGNPFPRAVVGGVVGGGAFLLVLAVIGIVLFKRRARRKEGSAHSTCHRSPEDEQYANAAFEPDVKKETSPLSHSAALEDNPLYESSAGARKVPVLEDNILYESSTQKSHPIFDDLEDNPLYESSAAASAGAGKPLKDKKGKPVKKPSTKQDDGNVYAVVNKKKTNRGDSYENVDLKMSKPVDEGSNSEEKVYENGGASSVLAPEIPQPVREVHDDGCVYVTVEGTSANPKRPKPPTAAKPKLDNDFKDDPVIYSAIDHSKKAPTMEAAADSNPQR